MIRSARLTRVALTWVAVDVSVVIASSSRFLHSTVCLPGHWQSCAVNFASGTSRRVTKLFEVHFADVDTADSSVVTVIRFGRSKFNIWQLWDNQHRFKQICRNIAWVPLPRRSTDTLQQSVVVSLLFWDSSHGLDDMGPVSSMTMRSVVFTRTPKNTPLDHLDSNLCRVRFRQSTHSPKLGNSILQGLPFKRACWLCDRVARALVEEQEKIGTMLDQPRQLRTPGLQDNSRLLLQEVFAGSRKSVHRLNRTLDFSVALALALGRCFRHNHAVPTILDSVAEGNNAGLLIRLEDDSLVSHEIQIGQQSPRRVRVRHTL